MKWKAEQQQGLHPFLSAYLDKHFAHGTVFGGAVNGHGLSVSRELEGEVLLHQLLDDLVGQMDGRGEKRLPSQPSENLQTLQEELAAVAHRVAGVRPVNLRQAGDVGVEDVHFLHEASQRRLSGLAHLLVHAFHLKWSKRRSILH